MKIQTLRNALLPLLLIALGPAAATGDEDPFVELSSAIPGIVIEMRYATDQNFLKEVLYESGDCLLRKPVAERLARVQKRLRARGLGLKVWDAYRPPAVQRRMWKIMPDPRFVADPAKGSVHNRGAAVDVTLVTTDGLQLDMGTDHDEFTDRASPDSEDVSVAVQANRRILAETMAAEGFRQLASEWWHFGAPEGKHYGIVEDGLIRTGSVDR